MISLKDYVQKSSRKEFRSGILGLMFFPIIAVGVLSSLVSVDESQSIYPSVLQIWLFFIWFILSISYKSLLVFGVNVMPLGWLTVAYFLVYMSISAVILWPPSVYESVPMIYFYMVAENEPWHKIILITCLLCFSASDIISIPSRYRNFLESKILPRRFNF